MIAKIVEGKPKSSLALYWTIVNVAKIPFTLFYIVRLIFFIAAFLLIMSKPHSFTEIKLLFQQVKEHLITMNFLNDALTLTSQLAIPAILLIVCFLAIFFIVRQKAYRYSITNQGFAVKDTFGLNNKDVTFSCIADVSIKQNILEKILGIMSLYISVIEPKKSMFLHRKYYKNKGIIRLQGLSPKTAEEILDTVSSRVSITKVENPAKQVLYEF